MPENPILITPESLSAFCQAILEAAGVPAGPAALTAESLVEANVRGVDSHGVLALPFYIRQIEAGNVDPAGAGKVVLESGGCLLYDGGLALGQVVSEICCRHVVRLAKANGIALAVARESGHFGAAAYWASKISAAGLIGLAFTNASPIVAPWQGREGRVGTNPVCMSVPGERLWLLDMATTAVAMGKVLKASVSGDASIPHGWALDSEGVPTTDPKAALKGGFPMPLGGYKGSGLAMLVEILCGVLGGGAMGTEVGGMRFFERPMRTSHAFVGIDAGRFMPIEEFRERLGRLRESVKSARPAAGFDEVLVAGEPEWRMEDERRRSGVPIAEGIWRTLEETAVRLKVPVPISEACSNPRMSLKDCGFTAANQS